MDINNVDVHTRVGRSLLSIKIGVRHLLTSLHVPRGRTKLLIVVCLLAALSDDSVGSQSWLVVSGWSWWFVWNFILWNCVGSFR